MRIASFISVFLIALCFSCTPSSNEKANTISNIFIFIDPGHHYGDYAFINGKAETSLDSLAMKSVLVDRVLLTSQDETANQRSLLTGLFSQTYNLFIDSLMQEELKAILFKDKQAKEKWVGDYAKNAIGRVSTLSHIMSNQGYQPIYIGSGSAFDPHEAGFEYLIQSADAISKLKEVKSSHVDQPFFTWIEIPHGPPGKIQTCSRFMDDILKSLSDDHLNDIIVFIQDRGKGEGLYQKITSPAIIRIPGMPAQRLDNILVQEVDLFATIVALASVELENKTDGLSLVDVIDGGKKRHRQYIAGQAEQKWLRTSDYLYLAGGKEKTHRLYDVSADPGCLDNIVDYHPSKVGRYKQVVNQMLAD